MAARKKQPETSVDLPVIGQEGDVCEECGAVLATDQRYCLNCGTRRGGSRLEFEQMLGSPAAAGGMMAMPAQGGRIPAYREWNPITAVGVIAVMGALLLLGVLIGRDDNNTTTVAAGTAPAAAATTPTDTTAAAPTDPNANAAAAAGNAGGGAVKGGSGSTEGIAVAQGPSTGKAASDAAKNGPDVVATPGNLPDQDPGGAAGGGSDATCIGGC